MTQCPSVSISQDGQSAHVARGSQSLQNSAQRSSDQVGSVASAIIQSPSISISQTSQPTHSTAGWSRSSPLDQTSAMAPSLTISLSQTNTPCLSVNFPSRSNIFSISQPHLIQSPLISITQGTTHPPSSATCSSSIASTVCVSTSSSPQLFQFLSTSMAQTSGSAGEPLPGYSSSNSASSCNSLTRMIQSTSISLSQANTNYSSPSVPCPTISSPQQLATPMNNPLSVLLSQILAGSAIQNQGASLVQSPQPGTGSALQAGPAVIDCNNLFWILLISGNILVVKVA